MAVRITSVEPGSPARRARIHKGDTLISINGNAITDVLDYRFYMTDEHLEILLCDQEKKLRTVVVEKDEYDDLGLEFETYLMDRQMGCKNACIFCFVDQTPPGMRKSLYFKDDDTRMSFLFGNYTTLTNLKEGDIQRIIKMHISPINISIQTMNPALRVQMMKNPFAGEIAQICADAYRGRNQNQHPDRAVSRLQRWGAVGIQPFRAGKTGTERAEHRGGSGRLDPLSGKTDAAAWLFSTGGGGSC